MIKDVSTAHSYRRVLTVANHHEKDVVSSFVVLGKAGASLPACPSQARSFTVIRAIR